MNTGTCFVCQEKCDKEAYAHYECSLAYSGKNSENRELMKFIRKLNKLIGDKVEIDVSEIKNLIKKQEKKMRKKYGK